MEVTKDMKFYLKVVAAFVLLGVLVLLMDFLQTSYGYRYLPYTIGVAYAFIGIVALLCIYYCVRRGMFTSFILGIILGFTGAFMWITLAVLTGHPVMESYLTDKYHLVEKPGEFTVFCYKNRWRSVSTLSRCLVPSSPVAEREAGRIISWSNWVWRITLVVGWLLIIFEIIRTRLSKRVEMKKI